VGVSYAKGLSYSLEKPFVGVNHIEGHIASNYITHKDLKPPFICLIISGGHTHLVHVKDYTEFEVVGRTRDDAIGEAFDKVARVIGLGYPGGPKVDNLAKEGQATEEFPIPRIKYTGNASHETCETKYDFSYSGLKTAVINLNYKDPNINKADLCMSFQKAATEALTINTFAAAKVLGVDKIVLAGGVSANSYIRQQFTEIATKENIEVYLPELEYCTDNAAMIASAGYFNYLAGNTSRAKLKCNSKSVYRIN